MRIMVLLMALWLSAPLHSGAAGSADAQATFEAANTLYDQGKFGEAVDAYRGLIQAGHGSRAVYFNLGNALLKSGQVGRAIAVYRTLEGSWPRDPDLRANLKFAVAQVKGSTVKTSMASEWVRRVTVDEWTLLAAAGFWVFLLLLTVRLIRPRTARPLRTWMLLAAVAALCGVAGLALAWKEGATSKAIVIAPEAPVRQAPLDDADVVMTVYDGAELHVLDQNRDFIQVAVDARRSGWIRKERVLSAASR